jgi:hypothetical protein
MSTPPRTEFVVKDLAASAAWFFTFAATYLLSIASDSRVELCYAILFAAAATLLVEMLHRADGRTFAINPRAILILTRRACIGAVKESCLLLGPRLYAQLSGRARDGRYIRVNIRRGPRDPEDEGRLAGVLWVQALTPNTIPLLVDSEQLVLHQLVHQREANVDDREFPA